MASLIEYKDIVNQLDPKLAKGVPQGVVDTINDMLGDPDMCEAYRENIVSWQVILKEGKYKVSNYLDAVKYVSHKIRGLTNAESYAITFPDKIKEWDARGLTEKQRSGFISMYHKGMLVTKLMEQSIIPTWIINQDLYQESLEKQAYLMRTSRSDMVAHLAAKCVMETLKRPEAAKIVVDVGIKENKVMSDLKSAMLELAATQKKALEAGVVDSRGIAEQKIIFQEVEDAEFTAEDSSSMVK